MVSSRRDEPSGGRLSDEQAYLLFEQLRWAGEPRTCPRCGTPGRSYLLRPVHGVRRTRTGAVTRRRIWKCAACRRQFSVLTGTVLEGTRVPLPSWIAAVEVLVGDRQPVSAADVSSATGLGAEAARHVIARWRAAATQDPLRSVTGSA